MRTSFKYRPLPCRRLGRRNDPRGRAGRGPRRRDSPRRRRPRRDEHGESHVTVVLLLLLRVGRRPEVVVDEIGVDEPLEVLLGLVPLQVDHGDVRVLEYLLGGDVGVGGDVGEGDDVALLGVVDDALGRVGLLQLVVVVGQVQVIGLAG